MVKQIDYKTISETQKKRIQELEKALRELIEVASMCDGVEYFPEDVLDDSRIILEKNNV